MAIEVVVEVHSHESGARKAKRGKGKPPLWHLEKEAVHVVGGDGQGNARHAGKFMHDTGCSYACAPAHLQHCHVAR